MLTALIILKVIIVSKGNVCFICLERVKTVDDGINEREHQLVTLFTYRYTDGDFLSLAVYEKKAENMEKRRPCSSFFVVCTVINHPDQ
jgi:hypothetical protein